MEKAEYMTKINYITQSKILCPPGLKSSASLSSLIPLPHVPHGQLRLLPQALLDLPD